MVVSLGLVLPDRQPVADDIHFAQAAEQAGFDTVWCYEISRDSQTRAVGVAQHTTSVEIGTCVSLWHSTPVSAAARAAEVQRWSGGRFRLGLGVGTETANRDHHGTPYDRPVARMGEYLDVLRGAWAASPDHPLDHDGESFVVRGYAGSDLDGDAPPVLLAAMGPAMVRLALSRADGIVMSPSATPTYARAVLRDAPGSGFRSVAVVRCAVDDDRAVARERARRSIAWYAALPAHARIAAQHGFSAEAQRIAAAWAGEDADAAVAAVSDAMIDTFALAGTPDDVRTQLARWDDVVHSVALITPSEGTSPDEIRHNLAGIVDTFA